MKRLTAGLLLAATTLLAGPATAQFAPGGGPIDMSADELELVDSQHLAIWRGAVEALQGRNRLRANELKIYFTGEPNASGGQSSGAPGRNWGRVQKVEAEGDVYFVTPSQTARGDRGVYVQGSETITITGDVVVAQGSSVVHGERLVVDLRTNRATMASGGSGKSGRVRGVFYSNNSTPPSGAPTPPPPRRP